ncbi:hypothetical protein [Streptomyces sp. NPDC048224]|uniref:hypothetical protein n=1 Tax=Streptomyces sp. NPDC048224 TaxID=3154500 RepID=UPI0033D57D47
MDSTVTAAVIAVPTALFAAIAAYAGARAQARSAHRGPVDAVRRQHQRDAYAGFLSALQAYEAATVWDTCYGQASHEASASGFSPSNPGWSAFAHGRARDLLATASLDEVMRTGAVVDLEGPDPIAASAKITVGMARQFQRQARLSSAPPAVQRDTLITAHDQFSLAMQGFVTAARAHLNSADG